MRGKVIWLAASCLMVLSLVLGACAPKAPAAPTVTPPKEQAAPKEAAPAVPPKFSESEAPKAAASTSEAPKYGGTVVLAADDTMPPTHFDSVYAGTNWNPPHAVSYDKLGRGDWTRGPAGTGEFHFLTTGYAPQGKDQEIGALATSWEIPDDQTFIFHIRQGVKFWDKPPVNGREMDAYDVEMSLRRHYLNPDKPTTYMVLGAPAGQKVVSVTAKDKWTVEVKVTGKAAPFTEELVDKSIWITARESIAAYGNLLDWRNAMGTGPFMLTDYVAGSSMSFVRFPNYWMTDPIGPGKGNQLPYLDGVKILYIPDDATRVTALITGKADHVLNVSWEQRNTLQKTNPSLKSGFSLRGNIAFLMEIRSNSTSPLAEPLKNLRVRQALVMAVDKQAIIRDLHGGNSPGVAIWYQFPGSATYTPIEEMPAILEKVHGFKPEEAQMVVKMYNEYNPELAKKLLAEAGYPNGFKTEDLAINEEVDYLSVISGYWKKNLNVDLAIDVKTSQVRTSISRQHTQNAIISAYGHTHWAFAEKWQHFKPDSESNNTQVKDDAVILSAINRADAAYGDVAARSQIIKETVPYILYQAWTLTFPGYYDYTMWQPWLKNYHGEFSVGYKEMHGWVRYAWMDQALKKSMGY